MELLKNCLLILGFSIMAVSLRPIRLLTANLPRGQIRTLWNVLGGLVCLFIAGYLAYTLLFWGTAQTVADLIVPIIFFFGAVFVLLVCLLSLQTSRDLMRIYMLEHETTTDSLTGTYNRRHFDRRLREEFSRSLRYNQPLSMIMIDIDFFKKVNDKWGHQVGDLVLRRLAELIMGSVREADVVCRYGGEEFSLILPHMDLEAAASLAERLRKQTVKTEILTEDASPSKQSVKITISLGIASLQPSISAADMLVCQADKALYCAKERGRNQVVSCDEGEGETRC